MPLIDRREKLEKALSEWIKMTEDVEIQVNNVIDGKKHKKELNALMSNCKLKFRRLEDVLKIY